MGYYTTFNLSFKFHDDWNEEWRDAAKLDILDELNEKGLTEFEHHDKLSCNCKWYEYRKDMCEISTRYDVLIILEGWGEERGDIWREYYLNGQYQRVEAKIVFDEFDETKLTSYEWF